MKKYKYYLIIGLIVYFVIVILSWKYLVGENFVNLGEFIGGVLGCLFAILSFIVLLVNFIENNNNTIKNNQENQFFSLLNTYNEYCKNLYIDSLDKNQEIHGQKTFLILTREFNLIYNEINSEIKNYKIDDNKKIKVAFYSLYYGVGPKSNVQLEQTLSSMLLDESIKDGIIETLKKISLFRYRTINNFHYYRPVGGQQSRLYQYFNFFELILSFIDRCKLITDKEKNNYVEILKTQLSLSEYFLIFNAAGTVKNSLLPYLKKYPFNINENKVYFDSFKINFYEYIDELLK